MDGAPQTYTFSMQSNTKNDKVGLGLNLVSDRICLLYTSDAADERSSVDLGGRRIIKKKKNVDVSGAERRDKRHEKIST